MKDMLVKLYDLPQKCEELEHLSKTISFRRPLAAEKSIVNNWVINEFPNYDISLFGHSRGGGIACLAASKFKEIKNLITLASVSNFGERFPNQNEIEKWKKNGVRYVENMRTKQMLPHLYQFYQNLILKI